MKPATLKLIDELAAQWRADMAAKGFRLYQAPFGIGMCRTDEYRETAQSLSNKLRGKK